MSHNDPHSDLNRAMRDEARQEAEAHAIATEMDVFHEKVASCEDEHELMEMVRAEKYTIEERSREMADIRRKLDRVEDERRRARRRMEMAEKRLEEVREDGY